MGREQDTVILPGIEYNADDIPDGFWNYVISVREGYTVLDRDGTVLTFKDNAVKGIRDIIDSDGNKVGELPAGLSHWTGCREEAERFRDEHPAAEALCVVRVLMLIHPDDMDDPSYGEVDHE